MTAIKVTVEIDGARYGKRIDPADKDTAATMGKMVSETIKENLKLEKADE